MGCDKCTLNRVSHTHHIPMEIVGTDPAILFLGEGPGADEDVEGRPFSGRAGRLLRATIAQTSIQNYALDNVVKCRPPGNRNPKLTEVKECMSYTLDDIAALPNLQLIVAVGNISLGGLLGKKGITRLSGTIVGEFIGKPVFALMHPAYILRNPDEQRDFEHHVARIPAAIAGMLHDASDRGVYHTITSMSMLRSVARQILKTGTATYDVETNGLNPYDPGTIVKCISFCIKPREAYTLPLVNLADTEREDVYCVLATILSDPSVKKEGHNIKFDNIMVAKRLGIPVRGTYWDTEISQYILDESSARGLKELAWKYSKCGGYENKLPLPVQDCEGDVLYEHCATDADMAKRVRIAHEKEMADFPQFQKVFHQLYMPSVDMLARMEMNGMYIDLPRVATCQDAIVDMAKSLEQAVHTQEPVKDFEEANHGEEFNINSHKQLQEVLFKYAGLPIIKLTDKAKLPSTDQDTLEQLASKSKLCEMLLDYSGYNSLKKFTEGLIKFTDHGNVVHTQYNLGRTTSGRTSSSSPNLQNIPKGDKDRVGIRKCFIARPNHILVEFDYSQHELRVMAEIANDDALREALKEDVHAATASILFNKPPSTITEDERREAKVINFGIIYCMTAYGIKQRLDCSDATANMFLDRILGKYKGIPKYMERIRNQVMTKQYVETMTGFRRRYVLPDPGTMSQRDYEIEINKIFREAINMPIQGTAGHILLLGSIGVDKILERRKTYTSWEVHDSLGLQMYKTEMALIPEIKHVLKTQFLNYLPNFKTPLEVDVKIGENWGEMEKYEC